MFLGTSAHVLFCQGTVMQKYPTGKGSPHFTAGKDTKITGLKCICNCNCKYKKVIKRDQILMTKYSCFMIYQIY